MTFIEKLQIIKRINQLIRMKATGTPNDLSRRLGISRRCLFDIISVMKELNAPVKFCKSNRSYVYEYDCEFTIGFEERIKAGKQNISFYYRIDNLSESFTRYKNMFKLVKAQFKEC